MFPFLPLHSVLLVCSQRPWGSTRSFHFWTGCAGVTTYFLPLTGRELWHFRKGPGFSSLYLLCIMTRSITQIRTNSTLNVSQRKISRIDQTTHIFHLGKVLEPASVRKITYVFNIIFESTELIYREDKIVIVFGQLIDYYKYSHEYHSKLNNVMAIVCRSAALHCPALLVHQIIHFYFNWNWTTYYFLNWIKQR